MRLEPHARGTLIIWAQPEPGRQYVIATDTAGGGSRDDFAVAIVLDGETCNVVAGLKERCDPHNWGPKCACLGFYYNEAVLAFETAPSAHGLAAATEAKHAGYQRLYHRRRQDTFKKTYTEVVGFHTNAETKPLFISRIKKGLEGDMIVPWEDLLREMKEQHWDDSQKMVSKGHDDMVDALGIALMVRDDCYQRGLIKETVVQPRTESERYWAREKARFERPARTNRRRSLRFPH